jgi:transcriptional regulator with XRE-family HTH domain
VSILAKSIIIDRIKVISEMARQNLTSEELAQAACIGRSSVLKVRKGQPVYRTTAQHVANALGIPLEDLMED